MKNLFVFCFIILAFKTSAQKKIETTDHLRSFSLKDLNAFNTKSIDSVVIYSHLMEPRKTILQIRGVLLKDIIDKAGIERESPKQLSEFYITSIASDNYKVVFSWNEIFNTPNGEFIMIITEADGKKADQLPDRIALLSAADKATGRRYVKSLEKIIIDRVK